MSFRSSSPDPLQAQDGPTVTATALTPARRLRPSPSKRLPPSSATTHVDVESPRKMTTTSNSILSPWRIKVVVEAERDSDDETVESPSRNYGRKKGKQVARTRTITVPIHGLEDERGGPLSIFADAAAPKRKTPARKRSRSRGESAPKTRTRTTTTKVPVKGLSSSPPVQAAEPKRGRSKARKTATKETPASKTNTKKAATKTSTTTRRGRRQSEVALDEGITVSKETEDVDMAKEISSVVEPEASQPQGEPKSTRKARTTRKTAAKPPVPTLASTRSRRVSRAPSSLASTPSKAMDKSLAPESSTRNALSRMDPNHLLSPSPARSTKSPSLRRPSPLSMRQNESTESRSTSLAREETVDVEETTRGGEALFEVDDESLPFEAPTFDGSHLTDSNFGMEDESNDEDQGLGDFTYISTKSSYTPRSKKKHGPDEDPEPSPLFEDNAVGVESFYGLPGDEVDVEDLPMADEDEQEDAREPSAADFTYITTADSYTPRGTKKRSVELNDHQDSPFRDDSMGEDSFYGHHKLPHEMSGNESGDGAMDTDGDDDDEPGVADFTYLSTGSSYTPRGPKKNGLLPASPDASPLFEDNPVSEETFYGNPTAEQDGQGSEQEEASERGLSLLSSPPRALSEANTRQSLFRSSPPFQVVIPTPRQRSLSTGGKRTRSPTLPNGDSPPPLVKRRIERETPDITRAVDASSVMSDALDVNDAMTMANQNFGHSFDRDGPLTPDYSGSEMGDAAFDASNTDGKHNAEAKEEEMGYPNISGIISPPHSQPPDPVPTQGPEPNEAPTRSSGIENQSPRKILRPQSREPLRSTRETPLGPSLTPETMSWAPTGRPRTPGGRSVHFVDDEPPTLEHEDASSYESRARQLEEEWEQERQEVSRKAQEVGAITIESDDESEHEVDSSGTNSQRTSAESSSNDSLSLEEQYARERSQVRRQAAEVGAITITDSSSMLPDESGVTMLNQDTAAFERSIARHIAEEEGAMISTPVSARKRSKLESSSTSISTRSRPATNVFTTRSEVSSRATSPPTVATTTSTWGATTASGERARLFTAINTPANENAAQNMLPDELVSLVNKSSVASEVPSPVPTRKEPEAGPSVPQGPVWETRHYALLERIYCSKGTHPVKMMDHPRTGKPVYWEFTIDVLYDPCITPAMLDDLDMDKNGRIVLFPKESGAVLRFMEREKKDGVIWPRVEVIRRMAGMIVADSRRRVQGRPTRFVRS